VRVPSRPLSPDEDSAAGAGAECRGLLVVHRRHSNQAPESSETGILNAVRDRESSAKLKRGLLGFRNGMARATGYGVPTAPGTRDESSCWVLRNEPNWRCSSCALSELDVLA
jgi:hypothetical protein